MMWQLVGLGLLAGLAAAPHCAGMCGCFALHVAGDGRRGTARRLGWYLAGKTLTYTFLGALAGAAGLALTAAPWLPAAQRLVAVAAGLLLLLAAARLLGLLPAPSAPACLRGGTIELLGGLGRASGPASAFSLGLVNGLLPCPITAAVLLSAATVHAVLGGMVVMAALALGTAPVLLAVGLGGHWVAPRLRRYGLKPAGLVLAVLGLVTLVRGTPWVERVCPEHQATFRSAAP